MRAGFAKFVWVFLFGFTPGSMTGEAHDSSSGDLLGVVRQFADVMIDQGRDHYGPQTSPLFLSALDRLTLEPLQVRPAAPAGVRRGDRPGRPWVAMQGANPMLDQNFLRLLYYLTDTTGDARYARAADDELRWFLENAMSSSTGLLAWGEHMSWDVGLDAPISGGESRVHEFARPWVLWRRCFALAPAPSRRFALGLWEHQIADHRTGAYDRHALFDQHGPRDGRDFPRHGAFYIGTWGEAWHHTQDPTFLTAIEAVLARFERKRHQPDGSEIATLGPLDLEMAARLVPDTLAARLRAFAQREDELLVPLIRQQVRHRALPLWQTGYSAGTMASQGMMCWERFAQTGSGDYRELLLGIADLYRQSLPEEDVDVWPMSFAHAISAQVAAFQLTQRSVYREEANRLARLAVRLFWQDQALPRASLHTGHYESITGADSLALALAQTHHVNRGWTNDLPRNTIDR